MPKKVKYEDDVEEITEEEMEEPLEQEQVKPVRLKKRSPAPAPEPVAPKKRYVAFANPARVGVADAETNEIVGEGETAVFEILADILERLERIENTLGNMIE